MGADDGRLQFNWRRALARVDHAKAEQRIREHYEAGRLQRVAEERAQDLLQVAHVTTVKQARTHLSLASVYAMGEARRARIVELLAEKLGVLPMLLYVDDPGGAPDAG